MQTFLPYSDFTKSAQCLDNRRLGKQRVECLQILQTIDFGPYQKAKKPGIFDLPKWEKCESKDWLKDTTIYYYRETPWQNHPAVKMWRNNEPLLCIYGLTICNEWKRRGFKDTCAEKIMNSPFARGGWSSNIRFTEQFHASHRSNLLRKDPIHYGQFGWTEPHDLPYIWPV